MPTVFIGMPVFNGERFIREAIDSLVNQSYEDWSLLISDNSSEDGTQKICELYASHDNRIQYFRQKTNIGVINNYRFVLDKADFNYKYFMWAASDDIWDSSFLNATVNVLENNANIGFAFSNIINIDSFGRTIRSYPNFQQFCSIDHYESILNYVLDPEFFGKANIIYSVYRIDIVKSVADIFFISNRWGSDMSFVLAVLSRTKLYIDDRILFKKRYTRNSDSIDAINSIEINRTLYKYIYPLHQFDEYMTDHFRATKDTPYYAFVEKVMKCRRELVDERLIVQNLNRTNPIISMLFNSFRRIATTHILLF